MGACVILEMQARNAATQKEPIVTTTETRPGYDWLGIPVPTATGPYCGPCGGRRAGIRHIDVAAIRACAAYISDNEWAVEDDHRAEQAAERALEDRGYWEARAQDEYEARNGVVGFTEAWHRDSPDTCPCGRHDAPEPGRSDDWWNLPIAASMWAADGRDLNA